jgi:hypothetical protein
VSENDRKPIPYLSLCGALGFALSMIAFAILELTQVAEPNLASQRTRVLYVMLCVLLAAWSSIVSLITAWCPIILGGDRRPWFWVLPLLLGWTIFFQVFDWRSLLPHGP